MKKFSYLQNGSEISVLAKRSVVVNNVTVLDLGEKGCILLNLENEWLATCPEMHYTGGTTVVPLVLDGRNRRIKATAVHELNDFKIIEPVTGGIIVVDRSNNVTWNTEAYSFVAAASYYIVVRDAEGKCGVWSCWKNRFKIEPCSASIEIKRRSFELTFPNGEQIYYTKDKKKLQKIGKIVECAENEVDDQKGYSYAFFTGNDGLIGVYDYIKSEALFPARFERVVNEGHYFKGIYPGEKGVSFFDADGDFFSAILS